mgnify:CR=1 FL=1
MNHYMFILYECVYLSMYCMYVFVSLLCMYMCLLYMHCMCFDWLYGRIVFLNSSASSVGWLPFGLPFFSLLFIHQSHRWFGRLAESLFGVVMWTSVYLKDEGLDCANHMCLGMSSQMTCIYVIMYVYICICIYSFNSNNLM